MASPQPAPPSPRRSRGLSFKSERSHKSSGSGNKLHLTETAEEKAKRNLHTKADPTVAMNELQPMAVALEKSNLGSLRSLQHKDQYGNPITDPDLSNPTRPRLERPLDTIRSFEAAIYGTHNSRPHSYSRTDEASQGGDHSRRGSYYDQNGANGYSSRRYNDQNAYYGGRGGQSRPDSLIDNYNQPSDNYYPYNNNQGGRSRPRLNGRMTSEQGMNGSNQQNVYPQHGYQKSYDNVTAASGTTSNNTDAYGNSTDPSSLSSSVDQLQQQQQQQRYEDKVADNYGFQGFGAGPNFNDGPGSAYAYNSTPSNGYGKSSPGMSPVMDPNTGGPVGGPPAAAVNHGHLRKTTNASETSDGKRKSWFKRKFSKD